MQQNILGRRRGEKKTYCVMSQKKKKKETLPYVGLFTYLFTAYLMTSVVDTVQVKCYDC